MFSGCINLISLDIDSNKFNIDTATSVEEMFNECRNLTYLDLSNIKGNNIVSSQIANIPTIRKYIIHNFCKSFCSAVFTTL